MDWKQSLDRWLTTPPNDGFDEYCESVIDAVSEQFYNDNEEWLFTHEADKLLQFCYSNGYNVQDAADYIENSKTLNT